MKELITDGASLASISKLGEALITTGRDSIEAPPLSIFLYSSILWTIIRVLLLKMSKNYFFSNPPSV